MQKLYEISPRFYEVGNLQVFDVPKGMVVVNLTRNKNDDTLHLVCKKVSLAKKKENKG